MINEIYSFYCDIKNINDRQLTVSFANKTIYDGSVSEVLITKIDDRYSISDNFLSIRQIIGYDSDDINKTIDIFCFIVKKKIEKLNKDIRHYFDIKISDSGLIYADNLDINNITFVIDIIVDICQQSVCSYMKNITEKEKKIFIKNIQHMFKDKFKNNAIVDYEEKKIFTGNSKKEYVVPIVTNINDKIILHDILHDINDGNAVNKVIVNGLDLGMSNYNFRAIYNNKTKNDINIGLITNVKIPLISDNNIKEINPNNYQ